MTIGRCYHFLLKCLPLLSSASIFFFIAKSPISPCVSFFSDFTSDPKDPKDPVSYSTMMCAGGSTPTWPIALDLLQMLQRQRLPGCNSRFPASDVAVAPVLGG